MVLMVVIDNQPHQKQSRILVSVFPSCYDNSHAIASKVNSLSLGGHSFEIVYTVGLNLASLI